MLEIRVPVPFEARILLDPGAFSSPNGSGPAAAAVLTLHGYGSSPETMLRLTRMTLGEAIPILSLQAPFQHYAGSPAEGEPAYNWGIRQHHANAVRLHHDIVNQAISLACNRFGVQPSQILLMGFSQPVGLNYRFLASNPGGVGAVAGICGGVPKDWETGSYAPAVPTPILHIARSEDEFFPASVTNGFPARLRHRASDVEFHQLPGGHRYPSKARSIFASWMARIFPEVTVTALSGK